MIKWLIGASLMFFCFSGSAQSSKHSSYRSLALVASNGLKNHHYVSGKDLKIHYYHNGEIVKAKGRLLIDGNDSLKLLPYGRKPPTFINTDSITSVSRWNRKGKKTLAILTGAGVAALALAAATLPAEASGLADGNLLTFTILLYAALDGYYLAIVAPIVFISEWLSIRSEKKGYHFSIE